ncbi:MULTISPECIES: tail fiber assembly protein [unclassified Pseudomonas]|nr:MULTISPECIES: tail fiber assembly protein [unclassified Pseudomonas]NTX88940.1 tail fiber assembly protein [Pseudomonas sp. UMA643]NTY17459.1 tail fiber assembly protein [Pseudomonas sp. UMC3103]NTY25276.1 tail fiber assembly protein [Pseudomonas sp. UMA603]NTY31556.1 tail fiber assembly protein [Pseudomonas sp. UMC3129]NTY54723.1 tail fiber assembly protein [Pseudomonas sp. UMC631]
MGSWLRPRRHRQKVAEWATLETAPLQDAVDLDEVMPKEVARLKTLKHYRIALSRLRQQAGRRLALSDRPIQAR